MLSDILGWVLFVVILMAGVSITMFYATEVWERWRK